MAPAVILSHLYPRAVGNQPLTGNDDDDDDNGLWSEKGQIIKYVVTAVVIVLLLLWVFGGMWHANRRIKKGKAPLFYHRWLAPSAFRQSGRRTVHASPMYATTVPRRENEQWNMNNWNYAMPPPSYTHDAPPGYQGPTKDAGTTTTVNAVGDASPRPDAVDRTAASGAPPYSGSMPIAPEQVHSPTGPVMPAVRYS
ncbi:MAG: hypothetical protein M1828_005404 [Chrysothrix sp. TS-e1954]|nr:MAG: hypothetical protein M1828_005404 [Chrysothrix sp. TS-e1954]